MIMIDQKHNQAEMRERAEDRRGAVMLGVVVALILSAETIVNWSVKAF